MEINLSHKINKYKAPGNDIEKKLVRIWSNVLKKEQIGINDDFFSLGGHSITATQIISRVNEEFNIELPFKIFFEDLNIATLTKIILSEGNKSESTPIKRVPR